MGFSDASTKTFSESWHRVAKLHVALRPTINSWRQDFRGVNWYVIQDSMTNHFYRVTPTAYYFLIRLTPDKKVEDIWAEMLLENPDISLSQEEVVQLLGQLYLSNLLYFQRASDEVVSSIFERLKKRRQREVNAKLMGFLSIKIPLFDPDNFLNKTLPVIKFLYSPAGWVMYLILLLFGAKILIENIDRMFDVGVGLLAPSNLPLLYVGFIIAKVVHEFSHAAVCKYFGGEVHVIGVMLLILAPIPYVDISASWGFRQGWKRLLVAAAGMLGEFAVASIAIIIWANTANGVVNSIAYNLIFVASVSTFLFNINPLLRFDGYYMFTDLFGIPNLFQRSRQQLQYLFERFLFFIKSAKPVARTMSEAVMLPLYGAMSLMYWVLLMSTIIYFVASEYLDVGMLLASILIIMFIIVPLVKFIHYLFLSPKLINQRAKVISITVLILTTLLLILGAIDVPDRIRVYGVIEANNYKKINAKESGFVSEVLTMVGSTVKPGQPLIKLQNKSIGLDIQLAKLQLRQLMIQELKAKSLSPSDLSSLSKQIESVKASLIDLHNKNLKLVVTSPINGKWHAPSIEESLGKWVKRGEELGEVLDISTFRFVAVIPQVASDVFNQNIDKLEIRLKGEEGKNIIATNMEIIPYEAGKLPSAALGMSGGGNIAVDPRDESGLTALEPFFLIYVDLDVNNITEKTFKHGRQGVLRIALTKKPLLYQWIRKIRQFLQPRFSI